MLSVAPGVQEIPLVTLRVSANSARQSTGESKHRVRIDSAALENHNSWVTWRVLRGLEEREIYGSRLTAAAGWGTHANDHKMEIFAPERGGGREMETRKVLGGNPVDLSTVSPLAARGRYMQAAGRRPDYKDMVCSLETHSSYLALDSGWLPARESGNQGFLREATPQSRGDRSSCNPIVFLFLALCKLH
ncbi:hypothetical protein RRG08_065607 [Elysia crispata]|uniref:Uncharacterized protein n=1 Tax=Elysia crispata TaxID=231223 RepID=A0AAE1D249_9GAST|nr:hypothetical protein RRG08_065607 [Elysia crispata]